MNNVVDLKSVEDVCRLCLSPDEPKSLIFGDTVSPASLATKIQACLSIDVSTYYYNMKSKSDSSSRSYFKLKYG